MEFSPRYQAAVNTALNTCENRWTTNNQFMRYHYQHIKVQFFGNFYPIFGHQYDCYLNLCMKNPPILNLVAKTNLEAIFLAPENFTKVRINSTSTEETIKIFINFLNDHKN